MNTWNSLTHHAQIIGLARNLTEDLGRGMGSYDCGSTSSGRLIRDTNRGREVLVDAPPTGEQTLEVETQ